MPELQDVVVESPVSAERHAEATHADFEEERGIITLLRDVRVLLRMILGEEYVVLSRASGRSLPARYLGPDPSSPGALRFAAIPLRQGRRHGRI